MQLDDVVRYIYGMGWSATLVPNSSKDGNSVRLRSAASLATVSF